jgi:hypothetical protein
MFFKSCATTCVGAALSLAVMSSGSVASAADMNVLKAPPPPPPVTLDIHGFFDVTFSNDYITPRGLLVTNTGLTTQILSGLAFDLYKDPTGPINLVSVYAGAWNDLWSVQNSPTVGSWNEFDWFVGGSVTFAKYWKAGAQYIVFLSPPGNFAQERNLELTLSFDDGSLTGYPVSINPYVKWFNAISGDSTVVVGNQGKTYDVEIGMVPTLALKKYTGVPLSFAVPTWVTVGPTSYWNRGVTGCGAVATAPCSLSNAGVFSTGLAAKLGLDAVPARLGSWYLKSGFQYYHMINDSLLLAQTFTGTATSFLTAHRDVWTWTAGLGFNF